MDASRQSNPGPGSPLTAEDPKGNASASVEGTSVSANPEPQSNAVPVSDPVHEITPEERSSIREGISLFGAEDLPREFADLEVHQQKEFAKLATWFANQPQTVASRIRFFRDMATPMSRNPYSRLR